jgi:hypothetical protein
MDRYDSFPTKKSKATQDEVLPETKKNLQKQKET